MNKEIKIENISGTDTIPFMKWLVDVPEKKQVDSEPLRSILVNVFNGKYHGLLVSLSGKPTGLLIYHMITDRHIAFKFMYVRSNMARCYMALMEYFNEYRIESFEFESMHKPKLWDRIYPGSIKALRTTYMFDVKGLFTSKSQEKRLDVQTASTVLRDRAAGWERLKADDAV